MPELELALRLAPLSVAWGNTFSARGGSACALRGPGDNVEETKRRTAAMMLSRTGRDRDPPIDCGHIDEVWRAPWGCVAGAPYQGTTSPPPPPCCVHFIRLLLTEFV